MNAAFCESDTQVVVFNSPTFELLIVAIDGDKIAAPESHVAAYAGGAVYLVSARQYMAYQGHAYRFLSVFEYAA